MSDGAQGPQGVQGEPGPTGSVTAASGLTLTEISAPFPATGPAEHFLAVDAADGLLKIKQPNDGNVVEVGSGGGSLGIFNRVTSPPSTGSDEFAIYILSSDKKPYFRGENNAIPQEILLGFAPDSRYSTNQASILGSSGMDLVSTGGDDSTDLTNAFGFNFGFFGTPYTEAYVIGNSYILFGSSDTSIVTDASEVTVKGIYINSKDNSAQQIFQYTTSEYTRIRFEGTNANSGTQGNPDLEWEIIFFDNGSIQLTTGTVSDLTGYTAINNALGSETTISLEENKSWAILYDDFQNKYRVFEGSYLDSNGNPVEAPASNITLPITLTYSSDGDTNGVVYYLGSDGLNQSFTYPYPTLNKLNILTFNNQRTTFTTLIKK